MEYFLKKKKTVLIIFFQFGSSCLATDCYFADLCCAHTLGKSTVIDIVQKTVDVIWMKLKDRVMKEPSTEAWLDIARRFEKHTFPELHWIPKQISVTRTTRLPHVIVGDEAFSLSENITRPYCGKNLTKAKRTFNYYLSRARCYGERCFGILWRIFHKPLNVNTDFAQNIIKACCVLRNYVRLRDGYRYEDTLFKTTLDNTHKLKASFALKLVAETVMYEVRKDNPFYTPLKVCKYFWFFDLDINKSHLTGSDVSKMVLLVTLFILQVILPTLHLFEVAKVYEDISSSEDIAHLIGGAGFLLICYKTMYSNHHFNKVFRDLTETERYGKPTTFDAEVKYCRLVSKAFLLYTAVAPIIYTYISVYESTHGACMKHQVETTKELYCVSVFPIWLPVKVNTSVIILLQMFCAWQLYTPAAQVCTTIYEEIILVLSHMDHLASRLREVFHVRETKRRLRILGCCAEYHSHIVELALEVNELHMKITGHMALVWAVSMGCISNQLLSMSTAIAEKLYCTPWYLGTIEEQKMIMFMIMRAQVPVTLSAKPFGNYEYSLIVKTAYSYVTLLQSTT
nr:unnamed protein product [Callosobruchus analis]